MRHERSSSTVVMVVGLATLVQGFMPPAALPQASLQQPRASTARLGRSTAATSDGTSRIRRTVACAAADSTELLLDLGEGNTSAEDDTPGRAPAVVEAGGLLDTVANETKEGSEEGAGEEEEGGWVEDSAELLSMGAGAIGAGVKSVALASQPLKREASGRLVPDGQGLLNLVRDKDTTWKGGGRERQPLVSEVDNTAVRLGVGLSAVGGTSREV